MLCALRQRVTDDGQNAMFITGKADGISVQKNTAPGPFDRDCAHFKIILFGNHVDSSELAGILGIRLDLEADLLTLVESSEAVCYDSGEMHENIVAALVVSDKSKTFFCVEPFDCTLHCGTSVKNFCIL